MKKYFMFAVACVALVSCVKNEGAAPSSTPSDQKIVFDAPVVSSVTRAADTAQPGTQVNPYNPAEWFTVCALYHADAYTAGVTTQTYMDQVDVAYNTTDKGWDPLTAGGQDYYWPKKGYLTFIAYSPAAADKDCTPTWDQTGLKLTDYTVKAAGSHYDLMYSDFEKDKTANLGTLGTDFYGVQINFSHALSSVLFKVSSDKDYKAAGTTLTVTNIELVKMNNKATFTSGITAGNDSGTPSWTTPTGETSYKANTKDIELTNTPTPLDLTASTGNGNYLIIMPQDITADKKLVVEYTIQQGSGAAIAQKFEIDLTAYTYTTATETDVALNEYKMGYQYTFNIVIGLDKIYFAPQVADWTNASVKDIEI